MRDEPQNGQDILFIDRQDNHMGILYGHPDACLNGFSCATKGLFQNKRIVFAVIRADAFSFLDVCLPVTIKRIPVVSF